MKLMSHDALEHQEISVVSHPSSSSEVFRVDDGDEATLKQQQRLWKMKYFEIYGREGEDEGIFSVIDGKAFSNTVGMLTEEGQYKISILFRG